MTQSMWTESGYRYIERHVPARRPGEEHELDGALLFLASDASTYVIGQTIVVDGGFVAV
jgi:NAD(P)-dependent dehydrogenase (short-subunit alcohol dehydrogenase family)